VEQRLRLNEFKTLYRVWKQRVPWIDQLILGLLVWLEGKLIDARVKVEVDEAIEEYQSSQEPLTDCVTPVYTEKPSDTSIRLPEMRLSAPWYIDTKE